MKIVIIEDEQFTAEDLENSIKELRNNFQIVKKLTSVKESILYFEKNKEYDLVFSDIQLGDGLSFEIFKTIKVSAPVIFCTAYYNYDIDAFKATGIGYTLNPASKSAILQAIEKYERLVKPTIEVNEEIQKLLSTFKLNKSDKHTSILVHHKDKIIPIRIEDVAIFYKEHENCKLLNFEGTVFTINETLEKMEELSGASFFRANRQHLVNRKAVKELVQHFARKHVLKVNVNFEEDIVVSKEKTPLLMKWLEEF
ncbi:LytTR family DNA-binding domain-containing protein [soil metagenome]